MLNLTPTLTLTLTLILTRSWFFFADNSIFLNDSNLRYVTFTTATKKLASYSVQSASSCLAAHLWPYGITQVVEGNCELHADKSNKIRSCMGSRQSIVMKAGKQIQMHKNHLRLWRRQKTLESYRCLSNIIFHEWELYIYRHIYHWNISGNDQLINMWMTSVNSIWMIN